MRSLLVFVIGFSDLSAVTPQKQQKRITLIYSIAPVVTSISSLSSCRKSISQSHSEKNKDQYDTSICIGGDPQLFYHARDRNRCFPLFKFLNTLIGNRHQQLPVTRALRKYPRFKEIDISTNKFQRNFPNHKTHTLYNLYRFLVQVQKAHTIKLLRP